MIRWWTFVLLMGCIYPLMGQQSGRMETDRPDQTECPFIVKRGFMQVEMGFNAAQAGGFTSFLLPTTLIKYGIHPRLELRYVSTLSKNVHAPMEFNSEAIGFKWAITPGNRWFPRTSVISHYQLSNLNRDESERNSSPHSIADVVLTSQIELNETFGIGYNFGTEFHSNGTLEGIYRIAPNVILGKKGYAYLELFGRYPSADTDQWFDGGYAYYLSEHVKLDLSAGRSLSHGDDYYVALGISFRMQLFR